MSSKYDNVNVKPLNPDKYFLSPRKVLIGILYAAWNDRVSGHGLVEFFSFNISQFNNGETQAAIGAMVVEVVGGGGAGGVWTPETK